MSYRTRYIAGQHKAECDRCGFWYHSGQMRREWTGLFVCSGSGTSDCWEPRHPQDRIHGVKETQSAPWARPAKLTEVDDASIVFTSASTATVAEDVSDSATIYTAAATSGQALDVTFTLLADPSNRFEITSAGVLTLRTGKTLNFANAATHYVTILATDGKTSEVISVTITVTEV